RSKSRGVLSADLLELADPPTPPSIRSRATEPGMARRRLPRLIFGASAAALVLIAASAAWRAQDGRLPHPRAGPAPPPPPWGARLQRLEAGRTNREAPPPRSTPISKGPNSSEVKPPTPADRPTSLALARIEARLDELGQRLGAVQPGPDQVDQQVAQLGRDLD